MSCGEAGEAAAAAHCTGEWGGFMEAPEAFQLCCLPCSLCPRKCPFQPLAFTFNCQLEKRGCSLLFHLSSSLPFPGPGLPPLLPPFHTCLLWGGSQPGTPSPAVPDISRCAFSSLPRVTGSSAWALPGRAAWMQVLDAGFGCGDMLVAHILAAAYAVVPYGEVWSPRSHKHFLK